MVGEPRTNSLIHKGSSGKRAGSLSPVSAITQQDKRDDNDYDNDNANVDQGVVSYDDFSLEGISPEELQLWSKLAPEGQKLEDIRSPPPRRRDDSDAFKRTFCETMSIQLGYLMIVSAQASRNR